MNLIDQGAQNKVLRQHKADAQQALADKEKQVEKLQEKQRALRATVNEQTAGILRDQALIAKKKEEIQAMGAQVGEARERLQEQQKQHAAAIRRNKDLEVDTQRLGSALQSEASLREQAESDLAKATRANQAQAQRLETMEQVLKELEANSANTLAANAALEFQLSAQKAALEQAMEEKRALQKRVAASPQEQGHSSEDCEGELFDSASEAGVDLGDKLHDACEAGGGADADTEVGDVAAAQDAGTQGPGELTEAPNEQDEGARMGKRRAKGLAAQLHWETFQHPDLEDRRIDEHGRYLAKCKRCHKEGKQNKHDFKNFLDHIATGCKYADSKKAKAKAASAGASLLAMPGWVRSLPGPSDPAPVLPAEPALEPKPKVHECFDDE